MADLAVKFSQVLDMNAHDVHQRGNPTTRLGDERHSECAVLIGFEFGHSREPFSLSLDLMLGESCFRELAFVNAPRFQTLAT